jgi:hypothetical protein
MRLINIVTRTLLNFLSAGTTRFGGVFLLDMLE